MQEIGAHGGDAGMNAGDFQPLPTAAIAAFLLGCREPLLVLKVFQLASEVTQVASFPAVAVDRLVPAKRRGPQRCASARSPCAREPLNVPGPVPVSYRRWPVRPCVSGKLPPAGDPTAGMDAPVRCASDHLRSGTRMCIALCQPVVGGRFS